LFLLPDLTEEGAERWIHIEFLKYNTRHTGYFYFFLEKGDRAL
jgi:hypothetical protein